MKILLTIDYYKPYINGVITSTSNLYNELKKHGHDVRILTLNQEYKSKIEGDIYYLKSHDLKIYEGSRYCLRYKDEVIDELIDWCPDIIHSQHEFSSFKAALKIKKHTKAKLVHTYHTMYEDYIPYVCKVKLPTALNGALIRYFLNRRLKKVKTLIVPTNKVKENLANYHVKKEFEVIPTGIELSKYNKTISNHEYLTLREKYKLDEDEKVILFLGRLAREKNVDFIISSMKELKDYKLLIVGDGPDRERLQNMVFDLELENVIFTGRVAHEEVYKYYKIADLFVSASTSETQGLTYIEALASDLPIVCMYDQVLDNVLIDGVNGYYFYDHQTLEDKIQNAYFELDELKNGVLKTKYRYSTDYFYNKMIELYEKEIDKNYITIKERVKDYVRKII